MTKKKKSHNAGYQSGKKQKPKQQASSSDDDDGPMDMKSMMNQIYSNIPATVYSNGQKIEHADSRTSRNAFSSFLNNLPSDSQQSMKELLSRNLHCDEDEIEEIYGVPEKKNNKKNNNQKASSSSVQQPQQQKAKSNSTSTPTTITTTTTQATTKKSTTANIFNMEPLGESLKTIRFATSAEFDEHSKQFVEFHAKCAKAFKDEYGRNERMTGMPIATFDSELLEIAREEAAKTREAQANSKDKNEHKDHEYVMPLEPFVDKTCLPDWSVFKIYGNGNVIAGQLAGTICKLFRLPLGSVKIGYSLYYNWKRDYRDASEFEKRGPNDQLIAYSNTKKGIEEYREWKKKLDVHSKSFGYFNTRSAEDIIKTNLDWREKSKRVFKLELDTSKPLDEEENLNWLKYFHDRMITQKLHNDCCQDEVFDGSVEAIWTCLQWAIRKLYDPAVPKDYLHNFLAQNTFLSIRPNYRDHKFMCGLKSYTRFYSLHSYGCVDFKFASFHTTKYYSHVFYTNLMYRITNLADKESREDEKSGWKPIWDNRLVNDPRFQEEDWITIEKRQVNITLPQIKEIREVLIGKGKLNCIPISKLIHAVSNITGAGNCEVSLVDDSAWIEVRLRKICNESTPEDAEYKEHDFEKDIKEQLEEMKKKKPSKKKNRNPMQSDASYPNDEESGNMYRMLKNGRGGEGGPPGCGQM